MPGPTGPTEAQTQRLQRFNELSTTYTTNCDALRSKHDGLTSYQQREVKDTHGVDVIGDLDEIVVPVIEAGDIPTPDDVKNMEDAIAKVQKLSENLDLALGPLQAETNGINGH